MTTRLILHFQVIEYTLFQSGIFLEDFGYPRQTAKHVPCMGTVVQLDSLRIVAVRGREHVPLVATSVSDVAAVVRRAIEYQGEWPEVGGIQGNRLSPVEIQERMEKVLGMPPPFLLCHCRHIF